jgi:hypothetical protein
VCSAAAAFAPLAVPFGPRVLGGRGVRSARGAIPVACARRRRLLRSRRRRSLALALAALALTAALALALVLAPTRPLVPFAVHTVLAPGTLAFAQVVPATAAAAWSHARRF